MILKVILIFSVFICKVTSDCSLQTKCSDCFKHADDRCVWCSEPLKKDTERRCMSAKTYNDGGKKWCNGKGYNPDPEDPVILKNKPLTSIEPQIQITPQEVRVKLRPGTEATIEMNFKAADDFPLDVYYLVDSTSSMSKYRNNLQKKSVALYEKLNKTTNNVQFGLGAFSEKPSLPYSRPGFSTSYRNYLKLTKDISAFENAITHIKQESNLDLPEAALDALMQVLVCENELNWRPNARRVVVLITDGTFHSAGDGKILGIIRPNDRKCHLENDVNAKELEFDYPSLSQINKEASDRGVTIILAVSDENKVKQFGERILGSKLIALSEKNGFDDLIVKEYTKLLSQIEFESQVTSQHISAKIKNCISGCNIGYHETKKVEIAITVKSCPDSGDFNGTVTIMPVGLNEQLNIHVTGLCKCDCDNDVEMNSKFCNGHGNYTCGICNCNEKHFGGKCQLTGDSSDNNVENVMRCRAGDHDRFLCNGHGVCRQGQCKCNPKYSGSYCEYYDYACPQPKGKLCAGNGVCTANKCLCNNGWTGDDCACPSHQRDCIAPYSTKVCSGNGKCVCGVCDCTSTEGNVTHTGVYCGECRDCFKKRCKELEDYAECNYDQTEEYCAEKFNQTTEFIEVKKVNSTEFNDEQWENAHRCKKVLDDGSGIIFKYLESSVKKLYVIIRTDKEDAPKANIWLAIGSAIGAVLLIGILTLILWRTFIFIHDRREYNNFVKMAEAEGYDVSTNNPLYQDPTARFVNPTYSGNT